MQKSKIPEHFKAKGIEKARTKLQYEKMPSPEQQAYQRFVEARRIEMSVKETAKIEGRKEGRKEEKIEVAKNAIKAGADNTFIAQITGLSVEEIQKLRE